MVKFITQALGAALCLLLHAGAFAQPLSLAPDAPDRHVVTRGDTLWSIAGRFLEHPWRWPEIWQLNREQIRDPHWIYPGDIVYLDRQGDTPRLRLGKPVAVNGTGVGATPGTGTLRQERALPAVRTEAAADSAIPTIDGQAIAPFLNRPLVVDAQGLQTHPRIVATQDGRVYLSRGEIAYARDLPTDAEATEWHVYRAARPLLDPDTRQPIAWEALFLGSARLERAGDPATLRITAVTEEIGPGDRLMPATRNETVNYVPSPPESTVAGRIVSIYRGVAKAGRNNVVAVNLGSADGLTSGNVLAIRERARAILDPQTRERIILPGEPIGHLLVFRVFDKIAYGLIMTSSRDVSIGDDVVNP